MKVTPESPLLAIKLLGYLPGSPAFGDRKPWSPGEYRPG